jgi:hypothetical protein
MTLRIAAADKLLGAVPSGAALPLCLVLSSGQLGGLTNGLGWLLVGSTSCTSTSWSPSHERQALPIR